MGYTHYWKRKSKLDPVKFSAAVDDLLQVLAEAEKRGIVLAGPDGETGKPFIAHTVIAFNGKGEDSHETFWIENYEPKNEYEKGPLHFAFCKTAQKPYDVIVTAALIILKKHLGDALTLSSDGENEEWHEGAALCQKVLGYGAGFQIKGESHATV